MLSEFPSDKVIVSCDKCGMRKQYDRDAMVRAGGDRTLTHLLDEIIARIGCTANKTFNIYDRCGAKYEELVQLLGMSTSHRAPDR
ncbi:hypothetical protein [Aminobacter aminovorans]|nr:hypothetical protein [Aminobacter aminovorans]